MKKGDASVYHLGDWLVDPKRNTLTKDGQSKRIEPLAMDVLVFLMDRPHTVISPEEILKALWPTAVKEARLISKRINQIRRALGDDAKKPAIIQTIPKRGYQVIASVGRPGYNNTVQKPLGSEATSEKAAEAFSRGLAHLGTQDYFAPWLPAATREFERAVSFDPDYSLAWSYLALVYVIDAMWTSSDRFAEARAAADRALAHNDQLGAAHVAVGYIKLLHEWDIQSASKSFARAHALDASDIAVLHGYQLLLRIQERTEDAITVAKKLKRLAPGNVRVAAEQIKFYYEARMYEQAVAEAEHVKTLIPGYADLALASAYHKLGRFEESYRTRIDAYRLHGKRCDAYRLAMESGWGKNGYEGALRALSKLHRDDDPDLRNINEQELHVVFDKPEAALLSVERAIEQKKPAMIGLLHNPNFDELRTEAEFAGLLEQMNLTWDQPENPGRIADVARIQAFRGEAEAAKTQLENVITEKPDDSRLPLWIESLAWASFATGDYQSAVQWAQKVVEMKASATNSSFALLVQAASYNQLSLRLPAQIAWDSAQRLWPGTLDLQRDVQPLFMGNRTDSSLRFFSSLRSLE